MKTLATLAVAILFSQITWASVKKPSVTPGDVTLRSTLKLLDLPLAVRVKRIKRQGDAGYRNLIGLAFADEYHMSVRWRALVGLALVGGVKSLPELKKAANSKTWYMRSASLVAARNVDRSSAVRWSRRMLKDKALVVRSAAVRSLGILNDRFSTNELWLALEDKSNFRRGRSLFIRRQIVETLGKVAGKKDVYRFIKVLHDSDPDLYMPAMAALQRLTGRTLGGKDTPPNYRRFYWLKWWREQSKKS